jgi:hypothetical protein
MKVKMGRRERIPLDERVPGGGSRSKGKLGIKKAREERI